MSMAKVLSITQQEVTLPVYNLEVAGDESYIANKLVVHNCRCRWVRINTDFFKVEDGNVVQKTADEILAEQRAKGAGI